MRTRAQELSCLTIACWTAESDLGQTSLRTKIMHSQSLCVCVKDLQILMWDFSCLEFKAKTGKQALADFSNRACKGVRHKSAFLRGKRAWFHSLDLTYHYFVLIRSKDNNSVPSLFIFSALSFVLPYCDHILFLPWGCCLPSSALGLSAGKGEDPESCLSNLPSQTGQPGRHNKHHTLNEELDARQCKLSAKMTAEEQLSHLEHLGAQGGQLGLRDLVGLAEQ